MKILKRILILLVMFIAVVVGVALTKPDSFHVERINFSTIAWIFGPSDL